jgi:hypothetical protein
MAGSPIRHQVLRAAGALKPHPALSHSLSLGGQMFRTHYLLAVSLIAFGSATGPLRAQTGAQPVKQLSAAALESIKVWCDDATTVCGETPRQMFNGLRFVFEPQLGVLMQNGRNRFDETSFRALEKIGVASDLMGRRMGVQLLFIYPSTVQFDEQSPIRINNQLADANEGKVDVTWGATIGLTFLDGLLAAGYGILRYDPRDFATGFDSRSNTRDSFFYLNVQAVEAVKGAIKQGRRKDRPTETPE